MTGKKHRLEKMELPNNFNPFLADAFRVLNNSGIALPSENTDDDEDFNPESIEERINKPNLIDAEKRSKTKKKRQKTDSAQQKNDPPSSKKKNQSGNNSTRKQKPSAADYATPEASLYSRNKVAFVNSFVALSEDVGKLLQNNLLHSEAIKIHKILLDKINSEMIRFTDMASRAECVASELEKRLRDIEVTVTQVNHVVQNVNIPNATTSFSANNSIRLVQYNLSFQF